MFIRTLIAALLITTSATAKIRVVTSTADLAYLASQVAGNLADVESIAGPTADLHFIEARPSHMVKLARADLAFKIGLELDMWFDKIVDGSRNGKLVVIDCSEHIEALEVPEFKADARYGDLHRYGNPHYWTGPQNLEGIVRSVVDGYSKVDAAHADTYKANADRFLATVRDSLPELKEMAQPLKDLSIVFYHDTWPYFNAYFGSKASEFIEPYPGVPPSPSHIKHLVEYIKGHDIKVIAIEPYFDDRVPDHLARETGATVVTVYPSLGGRQKGESYVEWLRGNIAALVEAGK